MKVKSFAAPVFACLLTVIAIAYAFGALAHEFQAGDIKIDHPWARPSLGEVKVGAAYLVLDNKGDQTDRLVSAKADIAKRVEIHDIVVEDGFAKMVLQKDGVEIPAKSTVAFKPKGKHIMLFGLKQKLEEGQSFPMLLQFEKQGEVAVVVKIETPDDTSKDEMDHSKHGGHGHHGQGHGKDDRGS